MDPYMFGTDTRTTPKFHVVLRCAYWSLHVHYSSIALLWYRRGTYVVYTICSYTLLLSSLCFPSLVIFSE